MSGVIDENGVQWEHCYLCAKWVKVDLLGYLPPNTHPQFPGGADIGLCCINTLTQEELEAVIPSLHWMPIYENLGDIE